MGLEYLQKSGIEVRSLKIIAHRSNLCNIYRFLLCNNCLLQINSAVCYSYNNYIVIYHLMTNCVIFIGGE